MLRRVLLKRPVAVASVASGASATDDFSGVADEESIANDGTWALVNGLLSGTAGGGIKSDASGTMTGARILSPSFAANQYAEVTLANAASGFGVIGPAVRCSNSAANWYGMYYDAASGTLYIFEVLAGSFVALTNAAKTYANGTKLRLEVTGTGASIRLTGKEDTGSGWVTVFSDQDPVNHYDTGQPGVTGFGQNADTHLKASAWAGGDL
jgi:hypothetical protein